MIPRKTKWLLIGLLIPVLFGCGGDDAQQSGAVQPVVVKTMTAEVQALEHRLTYAGSVEPIERARLATRIMGWVDAIPFAEGTRVQKGAVLVKLRSKDIEAKRAQVEASITEATAHFDNVQKNLQRVESLFAKKAATQKELDDTRTGFASAQSRKLAAEEMKSEVEEMLSYSELRAPFNGVVARKMLDVGDLANPGMPILEVENMDKIKIVAKVPESEIDALTVGISVAVKVSAVRIRSGGQAADVGTNGKTITGKIDRIVPAGDPMSRQFEIQVVVDNSGHQIKSGMFARVAVGNTESATLMVPTNAVFRRGQLQGIFVVDSENRARLRWVRTGVTQEGLVEILAGLNPGENVVLDGATSLVDGQAVSAERIRSGGEVAQ